MTWDATGASWAEIGIAGQPAWVLVRPDGTIDEGSYGPIDEQRVAAKVSSFKP